MTVSCDLSRWWRQEGRRNYFGNAIYPIVHCTQPTKNELCLSCHIDSSTSRKWRIVQKTVLYFPKSIMILFCQQLYGFIVPVHWNLKIIRKSCRWYQRSPTYSRNCHCTCVSVDIIPGKPWLSHSGYSRNLPQMQRFESRWMMTPVTDLLHQPSQLHWGLS